MLDQGGLLVGRRMAPTRSYGRALRPLGRAGLVHAMAHITGGGLLENIPRVLPEGLHAHVDADLWEQPRLMAFLQAQGNIEPEEMARTFNCGIGMALVVAAADEDKAIAALATAGEPAGPRRHIAAGEKGRAVPGPASP